MNFFNKKKIWTKVINSDTNDQKYNQDLINEFYKKIYNSQGKVISLQVIPDIDSEIIFPPSPPDEKNAEAFISSYPVFYITYFSKKEIYFSEDNFRNFYDRSLEDKVGNIQAKSLGKPAEN